MNKEPQKIIIAVDVVLFTVKDEKLCVVVVERARDPFAGMLSLLGSTLLVDESVDEAARRLLKAEIAVNVSYLEQLYTFSKPNRDPRDRSISVSYWAFVEAGKLIAKQGVSKGRAKIVPVEKLKEAAFDHQEIIQYARKRLRSKTEYTTVALSFLPAEFTLTELQSVYEIALGRKLDKRNFRRKMSQLKFVIETDNYSAGKRQRPARLYKAASRQVTELPRFI